MSSSTSQRGFWVTRLVAAFTLQAGAHKTVAGKMLKACQFQFVHPCMVETILEPAAVLAQADR